MSVENFKPLDDDASVANVGGISLENTGGSVLVTGSIEFVRDVNSVANARELSELFAKIAEKLEIDIEAGLSADELDEGAVTEVANPF